MKKISNSHIADLEEARYGAMLKANAAVLEELLHDRLAYVHSNGVSDSKQSYVEGVQSGKWRYKAIVRADERIEVIGNAALVYNHLYIELDVNAEPKVVDSLALAVWVYENERWQLIALQSTSLPG